MSNHRQFQAQWIVGALAPGEYLDTTLPNFGLRVGATRRTYFVRVRERGKRVRVPLGEAPHPGMSAAAKALTITLAEAREKATDQLKLHRQGAVLRPPLVTTPAEIATTDLRPETMTVAHLAAAWVAAHDPTVPRADGERVWSDGWHRNVKSYLARLVLPRIGHELAARVTRAQVRALLRDYRKQATVGANQLHAICLRLFAWAVEEDYLTENVTLGIPEPYDGGNNDRSNVLDVAGIRSLWAQLDHYEVHGARARDRVQTAIWRLRLLTAQREITLRRTQWAWVDFAEGVIRFPPPAMKTGKVQPVPHLVPLGPMALAILEKRRARAHVADKFVFGTRTGCAKVPSVARGITFDLPDFQGKDLRRTATTLMRKHGRISREDVKWVLHHKVKDVTGIYDQYDNFEEKQHALTTLDRIVTLILQPGDAAARIAEAFPRAAKAPASLRLIDGGAREEVAS